MENTYILGQPATGKRDLLLLLLLDRIDQGIFIVDDSDAVLDMVPKHRRKHVILFDPTIEDAVLPWNPLSGPGDPIYRATVLLDAMKGAWGYEDMTTPDLDLYLSFSLASLMEADQPLLGLPRLFTDEAYRTSVLKHVSNPVIKDHWAEYDKTLPKDRRQESKSTLNKVKLLLSDPRIARCLAYPETGLDFAELVGKGHVFVAVLKPGELGESKVRLLASLLLASVTQALKREHPPFHLFLPECQRFAPAIAIDLLTNAHRYGSTVTASHQYIDQIPTPYFSALMGTCARKYVFRTSEEDARVLDRHIPRNQNVVGFDELPNRKARKFPFDKTDFYGYAPTIESKESYRQDILDHLGLTRFVKGGESKVREFFGG